MFQYDESMPVEERFLDYLLHALEKINPTLHHHVSRQKQFNTIRLFSLKQNNFLTLWTSFCRFPTWLIHV